VLSRRTAWNLRGNVFADRLEAARSSPRPLIDLTESNPTRCGLGWDPAELGTLLSDPRNAAYEPTPRGLPEAREAVGRYLATRGAAVAPDRVLLTASTSEAYALLFKLLCDPGDEVLVPSPSYPLLDLLADLESVHLTRYPLRYDGDWHIDCAALAAAVTPATRAVVIVSPANPAGALLSPEELSFLEGLCAARELALVGDEVFADTALGPSPSVAGASRCLAFHLSGLSKVCGLPQLKAAWMAAAGPERLVGSALSRLEVIADAYLSVSTPAQLALPALLARRERFLGRLRERLAQNRACLAMAVLREAPWSLLRSAGGWSAVLQIGEASEEEALCLALLEDGVAVQPGFFYDFPRNGHLVVSLLPRPETFRDGLARIEGRLRLAL
jgi:alanine-synthesizing transaminase